MIRRLSPEWAPQSGVMLTWPHSEQDWDENLSLVEATFVSIAGAITRQEKLLVVCHSSDHLIRTQTMLTSHGCDPGQLMFHIAPSNDVWARDHGPLTVRIGDEVSLLDFTFNGWGGKYPADLDNQITASLCKSGPLATHRRESIPLVLEGGAIETDGEGTLLATRSSLLTRTRNPGLKQADLECHLTELLGITRFLWLDNGHIRGDDTDGHIDTLARFCDKRTITYVCPAPHQANDYPALQAMGRELAEYRTTTGEPYRLVPVPVPEPITNKNGDELPASYVNFLIINGAVLVPVYDDPADAQACHQIQQCFPNRKIIPLRCDSLIQQFGSLHCVSMQFPAGVL